MKATIQPAQYSVSVMANQGFDSEYPAAVFPWLVFIRNLGNPLGSAWSFHRTAADAEAFKAEAIGKLNGTN